MIRYINTTLDYILFKNRGLNRNCECDYGIISINILLLLVKRLGKVATLS